MISDPNETTAVATECTKDEGCQSNSAECTKDEACTSETNAVPCETAEVPAATDQSSN